MADTTDTLKADSDEGVDIYVWKPGQARTPRPAAVQAPDLRVTTTTPWSRTWRIFAAGLIMGIAATKAAELLMHPGRKTTREKSAQPEPPMG